MSSKFTISVCVIASLLPFTAESRDTSVLDVGLQVQSCVFRFKDALDGSVNRPSEENNFEWAGYSATVKVSGEEESFGFNFSCHSNFSDINEVATDYGCYFNSEQNKWLPAFPGASPDEVSRLRKVTKTFPLTSKNGHGFYMIQDETVGEPDRRVRHISYCLFHETKAICGLGEVKRLVDAKSDMLPYALRILRSVEFLDIRRNQ
ncbi:hypothetical protein J8I87_20510 [Paraburkholderia sp. LEh10]|uniref:hypothetical protein n=1 Tax=Paraburkholderia sp. LEh10 TaxID=2821353 RepID=UPI001AEA9F13|nr:hypothetical protein [Paraburkholderia sp. LEh10]MBP0592067.1 hypothetical protein [Paraburkholderia sp. LEh10]